MATKIKVKRDGDLIKMFIDGEALSFGQSGEASAQLEAGDHPLTWVALGSPGTQFGVSITEPAAAAFKFQGTFDSSGKDAGVHWVHV